MQVRIEDFRIHDLRHMFAAWLVSEGIPLAAVRDRLDRSTIKKTERYAQLAFENLLAAAALDGSTRKVSQDLVTMDLEPGV